MVVIENVVGVETNLRREVLGAHRTVGVVAAIVRPCPVREGPGSDLVVISRRSPGERSRGRRRRRRGLARADGGIAAFGRPQRFGVFLRVRGGFRTAARLELSPNCAIRAFISASSLRTRSVDSGVATEAGAVVVVAVVEAAGVAAAGAAVALAGATGLLSGPATSRNSTRAWLPGFGCRSLLRLQGQDVSPRHRSAQRELLC